MTDRTKITIEIDNLTEPQRLAIEDLLAQWQYLGGIGASRWTAFYADGDGNFQPKILVNGQKPEICTLTDPQKRWKKVWEEDVPACALHPHEVYMIDFDHIAWALHNKEEDK